MKLTVISPVRNERQRWLPSYLRVWSEIADQILLADNGSTDGSREFFREWSKVRDITPPFGANEAMFGNEAKWRKYMYLKAFSESEEGDVLAWADIDMVPAEDPRFFFNVEGIEAWISVLYDVWEKRDDGTLLYRDDEFWQGHTTKRIWAVRNCETVKSLGAEWLDRGMHCQHLPLSLLQNTDKLTMMQGPTLLHYGWMGEENRKRKLKVYQSLARKGHLTEFEYRHAMTAMDEAPNLEPLREQPKWEMEEAETVCES